MTQTPSQSVPEQAICEARLVEIDGQRGVLAIARTNYRLHLSIDAPPQTTIGRRIRGVITLPVWKVDRVSSGGAYIEPVIGRPRRVQGRVVQTIEGANQLVISTGSCRMLADLPDQYAAADYPPGTRIALDVYDGATFRPEA